MNKKKTTHIYKNRGLWYIRYKDPFSKKWKGVSTGLKDIDKNYQEAKSYRDEFLSKVKETEQLEIREGSINDVSILFKELNSNKTQATKNTYDYFFDYLSQFLDVSQPCMILNKIKSEEFLLWLAKFENLQRNTKFGIQKNFIKFLNFLFEYEYLPKPFRLNKDVRIKAQIKEPIIFTDEDRKKIISELTNQKKNDNFQLMIYLLMYSGLRPSDVINITAEQVNLRRMELRFYSSKTNNWFVRPLHNKVKKQLKEMIKSKQTGKLFEYSEVKNMGKAFQRYLTDIDLLGKGYDLRTFRKDFISRSQEAGVPINVTSSLVGHSNIKTTMTYYTKLSAAHLKNELKKVK